MPRRADPRKRTTLSGAPAQPASATPGQEYGKGVQEMALERQMPAPMATPVTAQMAQPAPIQQSNQAIKDLPDPNAEHQSALAAATAMADKTGILTAGTTRPNEPVTHGLPSGPGAGPEALAYQTMSPTNNILQMLTRVTGDPLFADLARRAGLQ